LMVIILQFVATRAMIKIKAAFLIALKI